MLMVAFSLSIMEVNGRVCAQFHSLEDIARHSSFARTSAVLFFGTGGTSIIPGGELLCDLTVQTVQSRLLWIICFAIDSAIFSHPALTVRVGCIFPQGVGFFWTS